MFVLITSDHSHSKCLGSAIGDDGRGHSPIYGFSNDGYPIHGPYHSDGTFAASCWQKRDYRSSSPTGCANGGRSCVLIDPLDYKKGTKSCYSGPSFSTKLNTLSGNPITCSVGVYKQDYFYNSTCRNQGARYLDSHNGHSHDSYGYHYHLTTDKNNRPTFPYGPTLRFRGCGQCNSSRCGLPPPCTATCVRTPTSPPTFAPSFTKTRSPTRPTALPSLSVVPTLKPSGSGVDYSCLHNKSWLLNSDNNDDYNSHFRTKTEVLDSGLDSYHTWKIVSHQIPAYKISVTSSLVDKLNSRPLASDEFSKCSGRTIAKSGQEYKFGDSFGFGSSCGLGFWPPGTAVCPSATSAAVSFPLEPAPEVSRGRNDEDCCSINTYYA